MRALALSIIVRFSPTIQLFSVNKFSFFISSFIVTIYKPLASIIVLLFLQMSTFPFINVTSPSFSIIAFTEAKGFCSNLAQIVHHLLYNFYFLIFPLVAHTWLHFSLQL